MPCSLTVLDFYCHCHCYCYYYYYHYYYYLHYYYYPASKNDLSITQEDTAASEKPQNGFDLSFRPRSLSGLVTEWYGHSEVAFKSYHVRQRGEDDGLN
ncbi:predicted protein [Sclerotinia sclerotiorum 1980 UF-70]|uniref:Uncharacterized protein n=1 Tax=Sclerotinia sclerotiorum (strain ATCC 18683 / 1980 / Ss-1) TaxID=665079 RepID=A7E3Z5_SCLS1|nr:predicted protein [Sclerotinia sclerotiorum 1980 UF-70]EDN90617.1 predicted protein [Sclerotinia sclerotiorum 1980 UF-70]